MGAEFDGITGLFTERNYLRIEVGGTICLQGKVDTERIDIGTDYCPCTVIGTDYLENKI